MRFEFHHNQVSASGEFFGEFSGLFFEMFGCISFKVGLYTQQVAQHIEFMFHQNGVPVTFFMFLA